MAKKKPKELITIRMHRLIAEENGLLTCVCLHPPNNHFNDELNSCAHCNCKEYEERLRPVGILLKE